ncbi:sulfurtransferase TusD, partial [Glaesserella parasuis]|nr:sulfurtransferase TusD [Glaesserella parasuis]
MRYVLAVKHGVYGSQGAYLAYQVAQAQALLAQGHRIEQI